MNPGIKALLSIRKANEFTFLLTRELLEREMWERLAPHNFITPETSQAERAKHISDSKESIAIALTFFEQMTLHSLLDKHQIMEHFSSVTAKVRQGMLERATEEGWSEAQIQEAKEWIDLYSLTITETFAELLYPRPQLEPELNASSAT